MTTYVDHRTNGCSCSAMLYYAFHCGAIRGYYCFCHAYGTNVTCWLRPCLGVLPSTPIAVSTLRSPSRMQGTCRSAGNTSSVPYNGTNTQCSSWWNEAGAVVGFVFCRRAWMALVGFTSGRVGVEGAMNSVLDDTVG